jgi:hypothetical protein
VDHGLSQTQAELTATSVGNLAIFASGTFNSSFVSSVVVDIYNASSSSWTTASLSQARYALATTLLGSLAFFGGGQHGSAALSVVDIYNALANSWTTASLSQGHWYLAATSVGSLALFAGGDYGGLLLQRGHLQCIDQQLDYIVALPGPRVPGNNIC